jgi:hypothetical protein
VEAIWTSRADPVKIMALRALISLTSADRHIVLSLNPHRLGYSWDATQLSIEHASVTAGRTAKTNFSHGGL